MAETYTPAEQYLIDMDARMELLDIEGLALQITDEDNESVGFAIETIIPDCPECNDLVLHLNINHQTYPDASIVFIWLVPSEVNAALAAN